MVIGFYLSYQFEKFREAKKNFFDKMNTQSKPKEDNLENKAN